MTVLPGNALQREGLSSAQPLDAAASFKFHCHPGVPCFTDCCRELELALSPYDVLRLRKSLSLSANDFLERYAIIEFGPDDLYPKVYLTMIDDGRASCPFVDPSTGCRVYADRPSACRTYPVGRGVSLDEQGTLHEQFILLHEEHCHGFAEEQTQTIANWQDDQQSKEYNRFNDLLLPLLKPAADSQSLVRFSDEQATLYIDTLYNLDLFKKKYLPDYALSADDQPALLSHALNWLLLQWQPAS
ncbi:MAG: YkgJ family cysteine cluster protein [Desulfobulbaceae bacterium]|nr:YkgJ family cysteine cluster protein [Desulfobulbaceae bacterium]